MAPGMMMVLVLFFMWVVNSFKILKEYEIHGTSIVNWAMIRE